MTLSVPDDGKNLWPTLGPLVTAWIEEHLCFGPGDLRGEPAVLDVEKVALVYRLYEVYPKGHELEGRRRFKRAGLSLVKGSAKSEFMAWLAAAELSGDAPVRCIGFDKKGNPLGGPVTDPFVMFCAFSEEQSNELAFNALRVVLEESPIAGDFDIGLERIMRKDGTGKAVSVSSSPSARDGARTTFACFDETHHYVLPRLKQAHQVVLNGLGKRKIAEPWALETTTMFEPGVGSVAENTHDYATAVHEGRVTDSSLFYFHRSASPSIDLTTEAGAKAGVIEAAGPTAAWRDIESIMQLWRDPTTDRAFWSRVWCNVLVKGSTQAFDVEKWKALKVTESPVKIGDAITLGFDGAMFHDATGLVATHVRTGYQWVVGAWECPPGREDWKVPTGEVDALVRDLFARYDVVRCYADPPYWQSWISQWQGAFGEEFVTEWWTNRRRQMSAALETFTTSMAEGRLTHDGDERLQRHLGNARREELKGWRDEQGKALWLIRKERPDSPMKIDLAMAAVLSWEARTDAIAAGALALGPSVYASRGALVM